MRDKLSSVNENIHGQAMMTPIQLVFESQRETTRKKWRHEEGKYTKRER